MTYSIIARTELKHPYLMLRIKLNPQSDAEKLAIQNTVAIGEIIENYLLLGITEYSVVEVIQRIGKDIFDLKAAKIDGFPTK